MRVNYTNELRDGDSSRNSERDSLLYAALMGNGCNIPLADLARSSDLDYQALWWVANNHFSDENVKKSNNIVVNFLHKQWLSEYWGDGTLSSSDGQRFPTSGKIRNATSIVKYFGFGRGVTFYTHTSDRSGGPSIFSIWFKSDCFYRTGCYRIGGPNTF
jgi:hypothetical protein